MKPQAIVYCENEFGKPDGKVANGLARYSEKYRIVGIIDSSKAGLDAGEYLDGIENGIPIYSSIEDALLILSHIPDFFIYGIAPLSPFLSKSEKKVIFSAMEKGMNIINGLPEFFTDDKEFMRKADECGVWIYDIRKPPHRKDLHTFTGRILNIQTPVIAVMGTDCAVGKRTTALKIVEALRQRGSIASFITTGQTGILQGSQYGIALDVLSSVFATGELEHAILKANEKENPDIIVVEGQGALSHPAFTSSSTILKGAMPKAIILQHPPKRRNHCDYPKIPMPGLAQEIDLIETFSKSRVVAITINHEDMTDDEVLDTIAEYEYHYKLPTTDVLKYGCDKIIDKLFDVFPELRQQALMI